MKPVVSPEEFKRALGLLEAVAADRTLLMSLSEEERIAFLKAAGLVATPERDLEVRLAKAVRRARRQAKQDKDRVVRAGTEIRTLRAQPVFVAPGPRALPEGAAQTRTLENPRHCYVCKVEFRTLHFFYDAMCPACGDFNYQKRFQTAPLEGKVALVTGARVKIGYQIGLFLLRSGASLIVTTRFPNDAAARYAAESDFASWGHRLTIHGLDLRHAPSVELLAKHLERTHDRLDILINNAAQTVRRPPGFYAHLQALESRRIDSLDPVQQRLLENHRACVEALAPDSGSGLDLAPSWRSGDPSLGIRASAALSLLPYALEQEEGVDALFPKGQLDADLQQVDLRAVNSWRLTLSQVATAEMLEVHLVNAVAPFILCSKLKGLMLRDRSEPGHIVNVSAMEGSFSRGTKTDKHPHTNMAKAALNMLTLTSAPDYAKSKIFMNAVDTGWVTDEDPKVHADRKVAELDFQPPLDIVDGAARVVDPIFDAVRTGNFVSGLFLKDYKPTAW